MRLSTSLYSGMPDIQEWSRSYAFPIRSFFGVRGALRAAGRLNGRALVDDSREAQDHFCSMSGTFLYCFTRNQSKALRSSGFLQSMQLDLGLRTMLRFVRKLG